MEDVFNLIFIQFILVFITDLSGFWYSVQEWISLWLSKGKTRDLNVDMPHILICSQCQTWWAGLIYLLVVGSFTFDMVALVAFLALMTSVVAEFMLKIIDFLKQ